MVELIFELRQRDDFSKLIIFAQFERMLHLIGNALRDFHIQFVYVQGSIRQCEKSIRRFKNDSAVQIMLLSSETTISGVHLVEANHMIAVHPPYGLTEDVAYAKMWQAIGRMRRLTQVRTCHAWSLITTGTLEEDMYRQQTNYARGKHEREGNVHWFE